ncbi:MAG: Zn-dependent hydrolase [Woeseia sp.]|nr:Zn-dependent hydrolase [Woeseia sp.]
MGLMIGIRILVIPIIAIAALLGFAGLALGQEKISASPARMEDRINALSHFGATPEGGVSRVAFSNADLEGRAYITELMQSAHLEVRIDAAGNILGRRSGREDGLPPILFGSHIDSVPGGGNYDGDVGVIGAIEVIELLNENNIETRHPLEVVSFTDEEGGLSGSRAMVGKLSKEALEVVSHSGMTIGEGIRHVGGDPDRLDLALKNPGDLAAFIELHIEQGAILYEEDIDIGVVEGIVGIRWWDVLIDGMANHAGTTPMNRRQDAMVTASKLVLSINRIANELEGRQVATVGRIQAFPGAPNVIPGRVAMSLEIRDLDAEKMQRVFDLIEDEAIRIANAGSTRIHFEELDVASPPAPTNHVMRDIIASAANQIGLTYRRMPSGAGHDAQDLALIAPTGMIFVPSVGGISHSPEEFTSAKDMANGANVLLHTVLAVDSGALDVSSDP